MSDDSDMKTSLEEIHKRMQIACSKRPKELNFFDPRLVAVSKLKPKEMIISAYQHGQRHFGENYVQELADKANDSEIQEKCPDIKWHMIGHVQSNKIAKLLSVPMSNLYMVETIDSNKLAESIDRAIGRINANMRLKVMVQINVSKEENKNGIDPTQASSLVHFIINECPNLEFVGLMMIGMYDYDTTQGPNPDFLNLLSCREDVSRTLGIDMKKIELSMGMTADYEQAIEMGSSNIRIGSAIFGARNYNK